MKKRASERFKQAGIITGINQLLGGLFSAIGPVAISGSAGFIATTNIYKRLPFILGSSFIIVVSIFPKITSFFAQSLLQLVMPLFILYSQA